MTRTSVLAPCRQKAKTGMDGAIRAPEYGPVRWLMLGGGVLATVGGVGHTATSVLIRRDARKQTAREGFRKSISLAPTKERVAPAEAFWFSAGSFGVPFVLLGSLVTRLARLGIRPNFR